MSYQKEMRKSLALLLAAGIVTFGAVALNAFAPHNQGLVGQANAAAQNGGQPSQVVGPENVVGFARSVGNPGNAAVGETTGSIAALTPRLQVEAVQLALKEAGFYDGQIDGVMGPNTQSAMSLYKIAYQVGPHVQSVPALLAHMKQNGASAGVQSPAAQVSVAPAVVIPPEPVGTAWDRQVIKNVQSVLAEFALDPGPLNGEISPQTREAVKAFQRYKRMPITGVIDDKLIDALEKISRRQIRV